MLKWNDILHVKEEQLILCQYNFSAFLRDDIFL